MGQRQTVTQYIYSMTVLKYILRDPSFFAFYYTYCTTLGCYFIAMHVDHSHRQFSGYSLYLKQHKKLFWFVTYIKPGVSAVSQFCLIILGSEDKFVYLTPLISLVTHIYLAAFKRPGKTGLNCLTGYELLLKQPQQLYDDFNPRR